MILRKSTLFLLALAAGFCTDSQTVYAAEPTAQASNVTFQNITCTSLRINWSRGNGARCVVFVKEGTAVDDVPSDGTVYTAFSAFGTGSEVGTGNFVVYSFLGNNITITGLKPNTVYHVAVFEHDNVLPDYLTSSPARGNVRTQYLNIDFDVSYTDSCQFGNKFTFTNKSNASYTGLNYVWAFGDGNTSNTTDPVHSYANGGNYFVSLSITPNNGCPGTYAPNKALLVIPNMFLRIGVNDTIQCLKNNEFQMINRDSTRIFNKLSFDYLWDFGDGERNTLPAPKKKYSKAGTFRIMHAAETYFSNNATGCRDTIYLDVTVQPDPATSSYVNDPVQCQKFQLFQFDNFTPSIISYNWRFGDGNTSTLKAPTHKYAAPGTYTVIHSAQSDQGCVGDDTFTVKVTRAPDPTFSGLDTVYCQFAPAALLTPATTGGIFYGSGISGNNFNPITPGFQDITYIVSDTVCADTSMQRTRIKTLPVFSLGADVVECTSNSVLLSSTASGTYQWSDGSSGSSIAVTRSGSYWLKVSNGGCESRDTVNVFIGRTPRINLPSDTSLCKGGFLFLSATWPASVYSWSTGSRDSVIMAAQAGTYRVTVSNPCGTATDEVNVFVQDNICNLFIPTAFTPNGDGFNEFFEITGKEITPVNLLIFNRWGEKVFQSSDGNFAWDGKANGELCQPGAYAWRFSYRLNLGSFSRLNTFDGTVQLIW